MDPSSLIRILCLTYFVCGSNVVPYLLLNSFPMNKSDWLAYEKERIRNRFEKHSRELRAARLYCLNWPKDFILKPITK